MADALILRALDPRPASIDEQARTIEIIAATETPVKREGLDGPFLEVLRIAPDAVDLSRLHGGGIPLLNSHRQADLSDILGTVIDARIERGALILTARVSENAAAAWTDIKAGIIRSPSVGYKVTAWDTVADRATGLPVRTATRWQLQELSLVPTGADPVAHIRSAPLMPDPVLQPVATPTVPPLLHTRAERNAEIRALVQTAGLARDLADDLIDRDAGVDEARSAVRTARLAAATPAVPVMPPQTSADDFARAAGEALYSRANPRHPLSEQARPFVNASTLDLAREALRRANQTPMGWSTEETIRRALHTTSDFPALLTDTTNRTLRAGYDPAEAVLKTAGRQTTAKDFRAMTKVQLGEMPLPQKVNEHGEYHYGSRAEATESYGIDRFGVIFGISGKALVNDDLGAFTDLTGQAGQGAAEFEAQFLVDRLIGAAGLGPLMKDGATLFHTSHGNLAATAGAISAATLSAARLAMRRQTSLAGRPINVTPAFLLVPPELETAAEQVIAAIQPTETSAVNPFAGKLKLLVEARLIDTKRWYLIGDPGRFEGLEYAYLQGAEGPQIETRAGFEVDGLEVKVRLDFGAAFVDWRAWYSNAGA